MRHQSAIIAPKSSTFIVIEPPDDVVPMGLRVNAVRGESLEEDSTKRLLPPHTAVKATGEEIEDLIVNDVKVGKNSQLASSSPFAASLLSKLSLKLDRTRGVLGVSVSLYNPHDFAVVVSFSFEGGELDDLGAIPLGFFGDLHFPRVTSYRVPPRERGTLTAWSQVGGHVFEVVLTRDVPLEAVVSVAIVKCVGSRVSSFAASGREAVWAEPAKCDMFLRDRGRNSILLGSETNEISAGDKVIVEFDNKTDREIKATDAVLLLVLPRKNL